MKQAMGFLQAAILALGLICPMAGWADADELNQKMVWLAQQGKYGQAIPVAQQIVAETEARFGAKDVRTATGYNNLAALFRATGRYEEAVSLFQRALAIRSEVLGAEHLDTAASLNNLAGLYLLMTRYDDALPLLRQALAIIEKAKGEDDPDTATIVNNLAGLYRQMGRYDEALPLFRRALVADERKLGVGHPGTAIDLNNLAGLFDEMGRYEEALPLYQRALAIDENVLGANHPDTAIDLNNLAGLYRAMGRYDEALPLYQRTLVIREKTLGTDHPDTAVSLNNLAGFVAEMGRYDEALPLYRRALAINEKALGRSHRNTATTLSNLAELYGMMERYDEALPLCQQALAIRENALGANHPDTADSLNNLGGLYFAVGRRDHAVSAFRRSLAIRERVLGSDHPETAVTLNNLAVAYKVMGHYDEALPLYRRAVRVVAVTDIRDSRRDHGAIEHLAKFSANLANLLKKSDDAGQLDEAIFYYKLSVNTRQRMRAGTRGLDAAMRESFTQQVADPYKALAELLIQRGRIAEAERVLLLLKEADLIEYVRRNGSDAAAQPGLQWTAEEEAYRQVLDEVAGRWRAFEDRRRTLEVKRGARSSDDPEVAQLDARRVQLEASTTTALQEAGRRFVAAAQAAHSARLAAFGEARTELATKLAEIHARGDGGLPTAGLLLLPGERGLNLIVTTENGAVPLMSKVSEKELNALVQALRAAIHDRTDYRPAAQALYAHLIAPAEAQLGPGAGIRQWAGSAARSPSGPG